MGAKKEALILKAIEERRTRRRPPSAAGHRGDRRPSSCRYLRAHAPDVEFIPVGSLRRGCETCGDLDILAVGGDDDG